MGPDKQKQQAQRKPGEKDEQGDLEQPNPPRSAAKSEREAGEDTLAQLSHRERKGPTLH